MRVSPGARFSAAHGPLAGQISIADDFEFTDEELGLVNPCNHARGAGTGASNRRLHILPAGTAGLRLVKDMFCHWHLSGKPTVRVLQYEVAA
jgi:hypothetical protein